MTDRELMQQALEALNRSDYLGWQLNIPIIKALRERLAQPVQEPVDSAEKAGAYMDARLWEFIDMAAAWPEAKPDPRTWEHVLVYAPKQPDRIQLTVRDFVVTVGGIEDAIGTPTYWAEWPNKEQA